ncbi:10502_t:CDS:2, partial [Entrophospora sp. SA101]
AVVAVQKYTSVFLLLFDKFLLSSFAKGTCGDNNSGVEEKEKKDVDDK